MTTTDSQTATEAYDEQVDRLLANFNRLHARLADHRVDQRRDSDNWGFVGDLIHWNEALDTLAFL